MRESLHRAWAGAKRACGHSRTIAIAYKLVLFGILDEAKLLNWSDLVGSTHAGRVVIAIAILAFVMRLVTYEPVDFSSPTGDPPK